MIGGFANFIQNFIFSIPTGATDPGSGFEIFDVTQGKVSMESAHDDYGVTLVQQLDGTFDVDAASTQALREELHNTHGFVPFFDRGPGYRQLSDRDYAEVDVF